MEHGDTISRRTANKKLAKLCWPSRKRSPERLIVLLEPKSGGARRQKNFSGAFRRIGAPPHFQIRSGATGHTEFFTVTHHGIWGRSLLLPMSLVKTHCVLPEPDGWLCLQIDFPSSVAELFRLPPLKSGTLDRNTSSQRPRTSFSGVTWKRFYYNNLFAQSTLVDLVVTSVT